MFRKVLGTIFVAAGLLVTISLFQNCSENGFKAADHGSTSSSSTDPGAIQNPLQSDVNIQASVLSKLEAGSPVTFEITSDGFLPTQPQWSHTFKGVAGACTETNGKTNPTYTINCPAAGALEVHLQGLLGDQARSFPTYLATIAAAPAVTPNPSAPEINMKVTFTIPAGTGNKPWNDAATTVETFIGQTLEIKNGDTVTHRLHTNGRPFPHGNNIAPGASGNYVIAQSYSRAANGAVYDHIAGTSAPFSLVAYDGAQLYTQNCASCHGPLANSERANAKVSMIKNAIANRPEMKIAPLMALTTRQIEAISYALGGR